MILVEEEQRDFKQNSVAFCGLIDVQAHKIVSSIDFSLVTKRNHTIPLKVFQLEKISAHSL